MATTPDGIPIIPSPSFQSAKLTDNPVQQLANSVPPTTQMHDCGYSVEENIFNKSRLDASLEQQRSDSAAKMNSLKADY